MTFRGVSDEKLRYAQLFLFVLALLFGFDYLATPAGELTKSLTVVEAAFPIPVWGIAFLLFGTLGLLGELWIELGVAYSLKHPHGPDWLQAGNRWVPTAVSHFALMVLYTGVGVGYVVNLIIAGHLWGARSPALMFLLAYGHLVFMNRGKR